MGSGFFGVTLTSDKNETEQLVCSFSVAEKTMFSLGKLSSFQCMRTRCNSDWFARGTMEHDHCGNKGCWQAPILKQSSVSCQLTSWGLPNTQSTILDLQGPHQTTKTSKKHPSENSSSLSVYIYVETNLMRKRSLGADEKIEKKWRKGNPSSVVHKFWWIQMVTQANEIET